MINQKTGSIPVTCSPRVRATTDVLVSHIASGWLAIAAFLLSGLAATAQTALTDRNADLSHDAGNIVSELAPLGVPPPKLTLGPQRKAHAIRLLMTAKRTETGWNRQIVLYLLATLGQDYARNRDELLDIWHECVVGDFDHDCDENTADVLLKLFAQGHTELLRPLLAGCRHSDGALSEELYPFYSDQLTRNPTRFVSALDAFLPSEQKVICGDAGEAICEQSGGGPTKGNYPKEMRTVLNNLAKTGGDTALRCSKSVRTGYKECVAGILEEEKGPKATQN